jgi:hypothetical protein
MRKSRDSKHTRLLKSKERKEKDSLMSYTTLISLRLELLPIKITFPSLMDQLISMDSDFKTMSVSFLFLKRLNFLIEIITKAIALKTYGSKQ